MNTDLQLNKLLFIYLFIYLFIFSNLIVRAQSCCDSVFIVGLKEEYKSNSSFNFTVSNETQDTVMFWIGLEQYTNEQWYEIYGDIFQLVCEKVIYKTMIIKGKEKMIVSWNPKDSHQMVFDLKTNVSKNIIVPIIGKFRFVLSCPSRNKKNDYDSCVSSAFYIK